MTDPDFSEEMAIYDSLSQEFRRFVSESKKGVCLRSIQDILAIFGERVVMQMLVEHGH